MYGMAWAVAAMPPLSLVELLREMEMGASNSLPCGAVQPPDLSLLLTPM